MGLRRRILIATILQEQEDFIGGGLKKARERALARLEEEKLHLREEQRNLARIARLGGDSSMSTTVVADLDPLFQFLAKFWQDPSATR
jgi:hypothetical protein